MSAKGDDKISGLQKAAILLISLGPEKSAAVFKHLKEEEIEELTLEIANTRSVSPQVKEQIINEFYEVCLAQQYIAEGGIGYAKELLEKAIEDGRDLDITKEELEKYLSSVVTVTFTYNGKVFGTQTVTRGDKATEPTLAPAATGSWNWDFSKPVNSDTTIEWK